MQYPKEHKEIVNDLLDGKFILQNEANYSVLTASEYSDDYKTFFEMSFGFDLVIDAEFAYLSSREKQKDKPARDFLIFLSVFCRELALEGKNFRTCIEQDTFDVDDIEQTLKQSVKWELLEKTSAAQPRDFLKRWKNKNVISFIGNNNNRFKFTSAVKVFLNAAEEIARLKMSDSVS
jgi:hypothetical protein